MAEKKAGEGGFKSFIASLWSGSKSRSQNQPISQEDAEVMKQYGIDTEDIDMSSIRDMFIEPEPPLPEAGGSGHSGGDPNTDENIRFASGDPLYSLMMRWQGQPVVEDPDITYSLSIFTEDGAAPSAEARGWLGGFQLEARGLLDKFNAELDLEREGEAGLKVDAQAFAVAGKDGMDAYLFMMPPTMEGEAATVETLQAALDKEGIIFGVDADKLADIAEGQRYLRLYHVATGQLPVDGEDGEIFDRFKREFEIHLTVREDNTIDYKDLGWLQTVEEGETICTIVPPTAATPGFNVFGKEIKGKDGKKASAPQGTGTEVSEDGSALVSKLDGAVTFENGRFRVDPMLIIQGDVTTATGNINMAGSVLIHGDVLEGFTVEATGDITVQGMIEGAHIIAGRDVQVGRGMNGNSHGVLQAKGEVRSKFIENATVTAGGKIICDTIINSTVSSDSVIEVKTGRGAIIGGSVTALERIEAQSIGNQSNRNIIINMGTTANLLRDKMELEQQRIVLKNEIDETEKNISFLDSGVDSDNNSLQQMSDDLKLKLSVMRMQLANTERNLELLNKKQTDNSSCRLRANVIYPPVQISIGSFNKTLRQMSFNSTVYLKNGSIEVATI